MSENYVLEAVRFGSWKEGRSRKTGPEERGLAGGAYPGQIRQNDAARWRLFFWYRPWRHRQGDSIRLPCTGYPG
jgi:hypothetical protein